MQTIPRALINVNINNYSNRADKSEITEDGKSLFKDNMANSRENSAYMTNTITNIALNPYCHKRNYFLTRFKDISEIELKK